MRYSFRIAYVKLGLAGFTTLGVDDNDAVCAADTINSRSGSVLENGKTFDILGIDVGDAAGYTVNDGKRGAHAGCKGAYTPYINSGIVETGFSAALHGYHACNTSCKGLAEICHRSLDFRGGQTLLGADHRNLLLSTITDDSGFGKRLGIERHLCVHHCLAGIGMRGGEKGGHHFVEKTLIGVEVCKRSLMVCKAHRTP